MEIKLTNGKTLLWIHLCTVWNSNRFLTKILFRNLWNFKLKDIWEGWLDFYLPWNYGACWFTEWLFALLLPPFLLKRDSNVALTIASFSFAMGCRWCSWPKWPILGHFLPRLPTTPVEKKISASITAGYSLVLQAFFFSVASGISMHF